MNDSNLQSLALWPYTSITHSLPEYLDTFTSFFLFTLLDGQRIHKEEELAVPASNRPAAAATALFYSNTQRRKNKISRKIGRRASRQTSKGMGQTVE